MPASLAGRQTAIFAKEKSKVITDLSVPAADKTPRIIQRYIREHEVIAELVNRQPDGKLS